jgi:hypothetical protein
LITTQAKKNNIVRHTYALFVNEIFKPTKNDLIISFKGSRFVGCTPRSFTRKKVNTEGMMIGQTSTDALNKYPFWISNAFRYL